MDKQLFIKTSDEKSAEGFRLDGLKELPKEGNMYVFVNNKNIKLTFDKSKVIFTNTLAI